MNLGGGRGTDELFDLAQEDEADAGHDDVAAVEAVEAVDARGPGWGNNYMDCWV